jgi:hypothetical protein
MLKNWEYQFEISRPPGRANSADSPEQYEKSRPFVSAISADSPGELAIGVRDWVLQKGGINEDREGIANSKTEGDLSPALDGCLQVLDTAITVIIEHGYFDLDARSEMAVTLVRQFQFTAPLHDRLHFFSSRVKYGEFESALTDNSEADRLRKDYLGYMVLRRDNAKHIVGRSMLTPPRKLSEVLKPDEFDSRVRTRVDEEVTLAGISLTVTGVPFMQQEGAVTRCAHAAAWMAHFTAVLRGVTPRVPVADLQRHDMATDRAYARQYPSPGLSDEQLCRALWRAGLPPELTKVLSMTDSREVLWSDRKAIHLNPNGHDWHRERFTSAIARYLNSGLPVLLAAGDHVRLICGYLRKSQLVSSEMDSVDSGRIEIDSGRIEMFIIHDDGTGPYQLVSVVDCLGFATAPEDLLVVPLPPGLNLPGDAAEDLGVGTIDQVLPKIADHLTELGAKNAPPLAALAAGLHSMKYAVRSFACDSNDFKASFAARCPDPEARSILSLTPLPKYVWVVEIVERMERIQGHSPVVGEVVIDATSPTGKDATALFIHFPGWVAMNDRISGEEFDFACSSETYDSGRWAQESPGTWIYRSNSRRFKTAGV